MKRISIFLGVCFLFIVLCTTEKDNPFDTNSDDYVSPSFTIDWNNTTMSQNGLLTVDSLFITLIGNTEHNEFRYRLDTLSWTAWSGSAAIKHKNIVLGSHTLYLATRYPDGTDIFTYTIQVTVRLRPTILNDKAIQKPGTSELDSAFFMYIDVVGSDTLKFQWFKNDSAISRAASDSLKFAALSFADSGLYYCIVANDLGADTSVTDTLVVIEVLDSVGPTILHGKAIQTHGTLKIDSAFGMYIEVTGSGTLQYQWYKKNVALSGATNDTLPFSALTYADTGAYRCIVTNDWGTDTSLSYTIYIVGDSTPPLILNDKTVLTHGTPELDSAFFMYIQAVGSDTLRYQWYNDNTAVSAETGDTLKIAALANADKGDYHCIVTNNYGADTSKVHTLNLNNHPPAWLQNPMHGTVLEGATYSLVLSDSCEDPDGDNLTFTLTANEAPDGDVITDSTYQFTAGYDDSGTYPVTITAGDGVEDEDATLQLTVVNVNRPPAFKIADSLPKLQYQIGEGVLLVIKYEAEDPDDDAVTCFLAQTNLPDSNTIVWTDSQMVWQAGVNDEGEYDVKLGATDNDSTIYVDIKVFVGDINIPPLIAMKKSTNEIIQEGGTVQVQEVQTLICTVSVSDLNSGDTPILLPMANAPFNIANMGTGSYDTATGLFTYTPSFSVSDGSKMRGDHVFQNVTFYAQDDAGALDTFIIHIEVVDSNSAPVWSQTTDNTTAMGGVQKSYDFLSAFLKDNEGDAVTFSANFGNFNSDTTAWQWTPDFHDEGDTILTITASDSHNPPASSTFRLTITVTPQYTLTVSVSGNGTVDPSSGTYPKGQTVQITPSPSANYHFDLWSGDATGSNNPLTVTMNSDLTITAHFVLDEYTVTFTANTGGTLNGTTPQTVQHGENCTSVNAEPGTGYDFSGWTGDYVGSTNPLTITNVTSAMSIFANFALKQYTLTVSSDGNGNVTGSGTVTHGVAQTITATPSTGYNFVSWTVISGSASILDANSTPTDVTLTTGNATVRANFQIKTYTLTVTSSSGGSASGGGTVTHGVANAITATVDDLYEFANWTVESGSASIANSTSASTTVTLTSGDATVKANFNYKGIFKTLGEDYSEGKAIVWDRTGYTIAGGENLSGYIVQVDVLGNELRDASYRWELNSVEKNTRFRDMIVANDYNLVCVGYAGDTKTESASYFLKANYQNLAVISEDEYAWAFGAPGWGPNNYANGIAQQETSYYKSATTWDGATGFVTGITTPTATDVTQISSVRGVDAYIVSASYYTVLAGTASGPLATVVNLLNNTWQWQHTTAETNSLYYKVRRLSDGSFIAVGYSDNGVILTKLTSAGGHSWTRALNNAGAWGHDVKQTSDGGFIIVGKTADNPTYTDILIIKTDGSGLNPWTKTYDWDGFDDIAYSVVETEGNDGYMITGEAGLSVSNHRILLMRTDLNGNVDTSK